jgi:hypothetical protein
MNKKLFTRLVATAAVVLLFSSCTKEFHSCECRDSDEITADVQVIATGLNNPRGLKFGPDGFLYVAEGGVGGSNSTEGLCTQVIPPVGPYTGSQTGGRISKISPFGDITTVTDQFPSSQTSVNLGSDVSGVADIAFIGKDLYAITAGAGCSHGVKDIPNLVARVKHDGDWKQVVDLSAFQQANPVAQPEEDDFEPDGTWYSMINVDGNLYALEPNHGELDKITPDGSISRVVDISASQGHIVPTVMAFHNGNFYVGNLNPFPIVEGSSSIYKISLSGEVSIWATGFNTVLGVVFDKKGHLYVLENTVGAEFPTPGMGRITRVSENGDKKVVVTGLSLPTGLTIGWDGNLYVSNVGFGPLSIGGGEILKIALHCTPGSAPVEK